MNNEFFICPMCFSIIDDEFNFVKDYKNINKNNLSYNTCNMCYEYFMWELNEYHY